MKRLMALMALTVLTACDYSVRRDIRSERDDRLYRAAMDDYRAGRMSEALAGFEKAIGNDPANASARFQLACLQQDIKKDYLSAYCGYHEYLLQHPDSDRSKLAKDRMAICEKEMAGALAAKYGMNTAEASERMLADARAEIKSLKDRVAASERDLGSSQERVRSLVAERDRLLETVKGIGDDGQTETADMREVLKEKNVLEQEVAEAAVANQDMLTEKRLLEEDDEDEAATSVAKTEKPEAPKEVGETKGEEPKAPKRPKTYVVKEGDTLFGISKRFYGSIQPWKSIRDANKAVISADNRLKAGDTIVLP